MAPVNCGWDYWLDNVQCMLGWQRNAKIKWQTIAWQHSALSHRVLKKLLTITIQHVQKIFARCTASLDLLELWPCPFQNSFYQTHAYPRTFFFTIGNAKGSHPLRKVQFFWTLFKRPLTPPPFRLNICPILQGGAGSENLIQCTYFTPKFHHQCLKSPFSCKFHVVKWPPEHTTISDIIF